MFAADGDPITEAGVKRLAHIHGHLKHLLDVDHLLFNIENNAGDPIACTSRLASHALASAMISWFEQSDIAATRQWFYVAARLEREVRIARKSRHASGALFRDLLYALTSNNVEMIDWFVRADELYEADQIENHRTPHFQTFQGVVALRGEWGRLKERCDILLRDPPAQRTLNRYAIDNAFYRALANGDIGSMQNAIEKLCTPTMRRNRSNAESGFTGDLISTDAVIYAKIAWRHGYELDIGSPYVPSAWLPNTPLANYDPQYRFLGKLEGRSKPSRAWWPFGNKSQRSPQRALPPRWGKGWDGGVA